jgi:hypothetical protein
MTEIYPLPMTTLTGRISLPKDTIGMPVSWMDWRCVATTTACCLRARSANHLRPAPHSMVKSMRSEKTVEATTNLMYHGRPRLLDEAGSSTAAAAGTVGGAGERLSDAERVALRHEAVVRPRRP